jgi:hypothetical protein
MDYDLDVMKGLVWPLILVLALIFASMQINGIALEQDVSPQYVEFYRNTFNVAGWAIVALLLFNIPREAGVGEILGLSRLNKAIIFFGFIGIIMFMTVGAGQMLPVPRASVEALQLTPATEIITSSVIPALAEDSLYLMAFPLVILTILMFIFKPQSRIVLVALMVVACIIATTGFNIWLIPGFTSAHVPTYGEQQDAYMGAWIFGFGQSMVYMTTGWLAPVAHFLHNAWITAGTLYGINIGGFAVLG